MASQRRLGLLFALVGPPGVGKNAMMNTVLNRLDDLRQLPTATTRPIRPSEQPGREHLFVNRDEFQQMVDDNTLLEWQIVHGEWYGMPKETVETAINQQQDLIADIDVLGATYLRSIYPDNAVLIFIQPPSIDVLKRRMQTRGETEAEIEKRLRRVDMEMQYAGLCDYLILNDNIDKASETLFAIILAERSHRALLNLRANNNLPRHKFIYAASVIALYEDKVLYNASEPHFPTARLTHGEFPHEAAYRALSETLKITAVPAQFHASGDQLTSDESFIVPSGIQLTVQEHYQQISFMFVYRIPNRFNPPQNWKYIQYQHANLPGAINMVIQETLSGDYPNQTIESYHEPA